MEAEVLLLQAMEGCDGKLGSEHPLTLVSVKLAAAKSDDFGRGGRWEDGQGNQRKDGVLIWLILLWFLMITLIMLI